MWEEQLVDPPSEDIIFKLYILLFGQSWKLNKLSTGPFSICLFFLAFDGKKFLEHQKDDFNQPTMCGGEGTLAGRNTQQTKY